MFCCVPMFLLLQIWDIQYMWPFSTNIFTPYAYLQKEILSFEWHVRRQTSFLLPVAMVNGRIRLYDCLLFRVTLREQGEHVPILTEQSKVSCCGTSRQAQALPSVGWISKLLPSGFQPTVMFVISVFQVFCEVFFPRDITTASSFVHLVHPAFGLQSKRHTSCFLPGGPTITWYAPERAVGNAEDGEGGGDGEGERGRAEEKLDEPDWKKRFWLEVRWESAYSDEAIGCVWAPLFRPSNSTDTYLQRFCVSGSALWPPNPPRTPQCCSLFSSPPNVISPPSRFIFIFLSQPRLHMHDKSASHWRRGGNGKRVEKQRGRHGERGAGCCTKKG